MRGPLQDVRVVEIAGIGPGPFAAMLFADLGAEVIRVDRAADAGRGPARDVLLRGRRSIALDLKQPDALEVARQLIAGADVLLEGFRPGVTERLGLGPDDCLALNPRLVYARMTGWGQEGPLSQRAGHDIGYIALTGALDGARRAGQLPVPPMNLLGDLGGGALYLAFGVLAAVLEARSSGQGQVVDAAIVDGTASLMNFVLGLRAQGAWSGPPGTNVLDTGMPFYDVYRCADGGEIAVGALEPQFYAELVELTGADHEAVQPANRHNPAMFEQARQYWTELFATRTRDEWAAILTDSDACVVPVLSLDEAAEHPHLRARGTYLDAHGLRQAAPAPLFDRTPAPPVGAPASPGEHTDDVLAALGYDASRIAMLRAAGAVA